MRKKKTNTTRVLSVVLSLLIVFSVISISTFKAKAAGTVDDFVERCYTVTLDRGSDPDGFADWKGQLLNGKSVGTNIAYGFLFSAEYKNKNKSDEDYVKDLYMLFMGREADEGGFSDWVGKLKEGKSREEVFAGFANSKEFYNLCEEYGITAGYYAPGFDRKQVNNVNLFVERLYQTCLGRRGDRDGQKDWVSKLLNKQITGIECARSFVQSKEYINKNLSDEDYVENMYKAMMGRASDEGGKNNWLYGLKNGMTRDEVFAGFANSKEFDEICKRYGISKGSYTANDIGTFNKDNPNNIPVDNNSNTHTHIYNQKVTESKYLKSDATCTESAVYFYSCECGEYDRNKTFVFGEPLGHEWNDGEKIQEATLTEEGLKKIKCIHSGCNETKEEIIPSIMSASEVGDIVKFGQYEQDCDEENGKEDIEWQILSKDGNKALIISKYALDSYRYNNKKENITWEKCSLRTWLNGDFLNNAFTKEEQRLIASTQLKNKNNPYYGTKGGNNTSDKVFCLSLEETELYFGDYVVYSEDEMWGFNYNLMCSPTEYAISRGVIPDTITEDYYYADNCLNPDGGMMAPSDFYPKDIIGKTVSSWWLRTPGEYQNRACEVGILGNTGAYFTYEVNSNSTAVRPALYIKY